MERLDPDPLLGRKVGAYRILERIGKGGEGAVYLADDPSLDRKVALKFLLSGDPESEQTRSRILSEARLAAAIDHPYICKIYGLGEYEGQTFISMEFVQGRTLKNRLREGPLTLRSALRTVIEVAEALVEAHDLGIIHRDLKPGNLIQTPGGHTKILDFGLARRVVPMLGGDQAGRSPQVLLGTPAYMSPEQIIGCSLDGQTDIFSLGSIFYEIVTGINPFLRSTLRETLSAVRDARQEPVYRYRPECPERLQRVIERMLTKEREERYGSARALLADLVKISKARLSVSGADPKVRSLAVLPFLNLSPKKENDYLSVGIMEEIIARLSQVPNLRVISRTTAMRYRDSKLDVRSIGVEIGVDAVLEGSIRKEGNRLRIVCRLVDVASEAQTWAEVFDRRIEDMFAFQTELTKEIAFALETTISNRDSLRTSGREKTNAKAYQFYLKGRHFLNKMSPQGLRRAISYFNQTLEEDPFYAPALAGLSTCYAELGHFGYMSEKEAYPKAMKAAAQALELEDNLPEAHTSSGFVCFYDWEWAAAVKAFRKAIQINPNYSDAHVFYSWCLVPLGRWSEALSEARTAMHVDPLSELASVNLGWILLCLARYEEAREQFASTIELEPLNRYARTLLAFALQGQGQLDRAIDILEKWAWSKPLLGWAYASAGRIDETRELLEEVTGPSQEDTYSPAQIALIYHFLGETDNALTWLETALKEHDTQLIHVRANVFASTLFTHNRAKEVYRKMGLEPEIVRLYQQMEGYLGAPRILAEITETASGE